MVDLIIASDCPHCDQQKDVMRKSFFPDEYRTIQVGSDEFEALDCKEDVDAVPFVVVRDESGRVKYAKAGVVDGTTLRKLERAAPFVFNLEKSKRS